MPRLPEQFEQLDDLLTRYAYADYLEEHGDSNELQEHLRKDYHAFGNIWEFLIEKMSAPFAMQIDVDDRRFRKEWIRDIIFKRNGSPGPWIMWGELWNNQFFSLLAYEGSRKWEAGHCTIMCSVARDFHLLACNSTRLTGVGEEITDMRLRRMIHPSQEAIVRMRTEDDRLFHREMEKIARLDAQDEVDWMIVGGGRTRVSDRFWIGQRTWATITDITRLQNICNFYLVIRLA